MYTYRDFVDNSYLTAHKDIVFRQKNATSHCKFLHSYNAHVSVGFHFETLESLHHASYYINRINDCLSLALKDILRYTSLNPIILLGEDDSDLISYFTSQHYHTSFMWLPSVSMEMFASNLHAKLIAYLKANKTLGMSRVDLVSLTQRMFVMVEEHKKNWVAHTANGDYYSGKNILPSEGNSCCYLNNKGILQPLGALEVDIAFKTPRLDSCNWVVDFGCLELKSLKAKLKEKLDHRVLVHKKDEVDEKFSSLFQTTEIGEQSVAEFITDLTYKTVNTLSKQYTVDVYTQSGEKLS